MPPMAPSVTVLCFRRHIIAAGKRTNSISLLLSCITVLLTVCSTLVPASAAAPGTLINKADCNILRGWDRYKFIPGVPQDCTNQPCSAFTHADCDANGRVTELNLFNRSLIGPLPDLSGLTKLTKLNLAANRLSGPLPASWGKLTELQLLHVYDNLLSGELPATWATMASLTDLNLKLNGIGGGLPSTWAALESLTYLDLSSNSLRGGFPPEWGSLANLKELYLYNNSFSEPLPKEWGALKGLQKLFIYDTNCGGALPAWIAGLTNLTAWNLQNNNLTGPLPASWSTLVNTVSIGLANNQISGPLPPTWRSFRSLQELGLENNRLDGTLPKEWGDLTQLTKLVLSGNNISGSIPESWGSMVKLTILWLNGTLVQGTMPARWKANRFTQRYLSHYMCGPGTDTDTCAPITPAGTGTGTSVPPPTDINGLGRNSTTGPATPKKEKSKLALAAGAAAGGVVLLLVGILGALCIVRRRLGGLRHLKPKLVLPIVNEATKDVAPPSLPGPGLAGNKQAVVPADGRPAPGNADMLPGRDQRLAYSMPVQDSVHSLQRSSLAGPMSSSQELQSRQIDLEESVPGSSVVTDAPVLGKSVATMLPLCLHLGFQIIESSMRVVCNNARCNQLVARISAMQPLLNQLQEHYGASVSEGGFSPREKEELQPMLQNIHDVFADTLTTINSWCSTGRFGSVATVLRNMATASWFQENFVELNLRLTGAFMDLTIAMHIQDRSARHYVDRQTVLEETQQQTKEDLHGLVEQLAAVGDDGRDGWEGLSLEDRQKLALIFAHHQLDLTPVVKTARKEALEKSASKLLIPWQEISKTRLIGKGGYGAVYAGTWKRTRVALKLLDVGPLTDRDKADVLREAFIHHRAQNHPNIIPLYGITISRDNECMLVMELASGDMQKLVSDTEVVLTAKRMYQLALEVAQGMDHLHSKGIVHGDLKPSNVLVRDSGALAVSDFGLSTINCVSLSASMSAARSKLDSESTALTICYSPPEFLSATMMKKTPAGDVYAFAMVLLEIFVGEMPYGGLPREAVMRTVLAGRRPPIPARVPSSCAQIIVQCWHQDPASRPAFAEVCDWLQQLYDNAK